MKLKQFLRPLDADFSTPRALRKLLRLLSGALMLCLLCTLAFALSMTFNHEVSLSRRTMNAAVYEAQLYLSQRESLLEHLARRVLPIAESTALADDTQAAERGLAMVVLPMGGDELGLLLSARDLDELRSKRLGLFHVEAGMYPVVTRLIQSGPPSAPLSPTVLEALSQKPPLETAPRVLWLSDAGEAERRLLLLERLGGGMNNGWLGLEIRGADLDAVLRVAGAGDYLLLDSRHRVAFASNFDKAPMEALRAWRAGDSFDFTGFSSPQVVLRKHLGASNWTLVYAIGVGQMLSALWLPLLLAALLVLVADVLLQRLNRRIDQRLIVPAQQRLETLKESEAFSRAVIQTAPVALCVLRRADASVVLENQQAQQWLGGSEVFASDGPAWIAQAFGEAGGAASAELQAGDGRHLYLCYTATRYKGEDVLLCAFSDISARKQAEAELARAKQLADTANEAKTLFLATMSHEIRTPLYGVLGTLELLGRTDLDLQQTGYLQAIHRSSSTLLQLISDVLDVSKIEAGQLDLELVEFSPVELTEDAVQSFAAAAEAKGVQIYAYLDPDLPARMRGDAACIRQILNNLLSNAVKFTDNGRIVVRLRAGLADGERRMLAWQVSDTGPGIDAQDQVHLFEPFYQVHRSTHQVGGTGLGLSICQRLTQLMSGSLTLVSEVGLGSSFSLRLPLESVPSPIEPQELAGCTVQVLSPVHELGENLCGWINRWGGRARLATPSVLAEADEHTLLVELQLPDVPCVAPPDWPGCRVIMSPDGYAEPRLQGCDWLVGLHGLGGLRRALARAQGCVYSACEQDGLAPPLRDFGLRVLVAEDNAINQLILKDQLEALGCVVELVSDGQEALQRWRPESFDVVLSDINMPRMNGYQLATELRRRGCQQPIIGATAKAMREERGRCLTAGMNECLLKPVDLESLQRCLADAIEGT